MHKLTKSRDKFNIEGPLLENEPLWRHTSYLIGGTADLYAVPAHLGDLEILCLNAAAEGVKLFVLGGGSNLLVADGGMRALVVDVREFRDWKMENGLLVLGAGLSMSDAAWRSGADGMAGLDGFFGLPGSVGGAVWMNARCYGAEIADSLQWIEVLNSEGRVQRFRRDEGTWDYKRSPFQGSRDIILRAAFSLVRGDPGRLRAAMVERWNDRRAKGHFRSPCAGSAFKNNKNFGAPSGVLIDRCGLKGLRRGGAAVSEWHGNIIINDAGAKAGEVLELLNEVRRRVERETGFHMEREVLVVGDWGET